MRSPRLIIIRKDFQGHGALSDEVWLSASQVISEMTDIGNLNGKVLQLALGRHTGLGLIKEIDSFPVICHF